MHTNLPLQGMARVDLLIDKRVKEGIAYTSGYTKDSMNAEHLRSYATERNNKWKKEVKQFVNDNPSRTMNGKINNNFYRKKFKYDVVVPLPIYSEIMDYYFYSLDNNVVEDVEFIEKYLDHMMMFCQAMFYYRDKYISYLQSKRDKTPMYVKLIYNFIGRDYIKILSFLQKLGLIDIDHMYVPKYMDYKSDSERKGICKHYSFEVNLGSASVVYQITNKVIINKAYVADVRISDDIEYAQTNSNTQRSKELTQYFSDNFDMSEDFKLNRSVDYNGFTYFYNRVSEEAGQRFSNFIIGRDTFGHRLYHPILNIKKEARQYVLINGKTNNSIVDINNSHPYIFSMFFDKNFLEFSKGLMTDDEYTLFDSVRTNELFKDKIELFKKITSSGKYYDFLYKNSQVGDYTVEYNQVKKLNMVYFYGPFNKRNSIHKFFDKNFDFINLIRYRIIRMSGYKRLCQLLQRVEAKIMIDDVFMNLKKDGYNTIPFHDAIMCSKKDTAVVKTRMLNSFKKIGVEYLPKFDKAGDATEVNNIFDKMKFVGGQQFLAKNLLLEQLNLIIKSVGISNRVFKDDMKPEAQIYIDTRFESLRHLIEDEVAEKYYELRLKYDMQQYDEVDYEALFEQYKTDRMVKKKFYGKDVVGYVKINPQEFFNYIHGTNFKTRVREKNYVY